MNEAMQGRLLSLLSLTVIALLIVIPLNTAWNRASQPLPADHGLSELAAVPAPAPGVSWECVVTAIEDAGLPGMRGGFRLGPNEDSEIDAELTIERDLGSDLHGRFETPGVLTVTGLPSQRLVPVDCDGA